ncbi:hypothetical protein ACWCQL_34760 [Streptomyces sp. NPDC002073]|uniref:hypothetical protein n=1 Tax=Streptomyces sp. NBC_00239 TaxID=2903640 RepID=UPI002E2E18DE|nr:hypothetical protein [Streptomyces sp. NBC_00239]
MAEHEDRDPQASGSGEPLDEEAAWAAIVAGYGEEPPDPPGSKPFKPIEDLLLPEGDVNVLPGPEPEGAGGAGDGGAAADAGDGVGSGAGSAAKPPLGSSVVFAPGVGPRDHSLPEPAEGDDSDEGHFVPPEPPPLPPADATAKFAWLAVVGGPVLLLLAILLQWDMTWWLTTLGVGGFLGGFATLVARMQGDDDEDGDDPGRGAVV